jgi:hypothetical protein
MTATEELLPTHQYDYYREQAHGSEDHHAYGRLSPQGSRDHTPQPFTDNKAKWCPQHDISRTDVAGLAGSFMMEPLEGENTQALGQPNQACTCAKKPERSSKKYRMKLIAGLVLPYFLASLDLTVVATALPFIASHFRK